MGGLRRAGAVAVGRPLRRLLPYTVLAAAMFAAAGVLGGAVGAGNGARTVLPIREAGTAPPAPSAVDLLAHNLPISLKTAVGFVLGGIPTVYFLAVNGFLVGSALVEGAAEFGLLTAVALLVPHGVFELPALWLAGGVAFRLTHGLWRTANGSRAGPPFPAYLHEAAVGVGLVAVLDAVAAVVEAEVTVALARMLAG